MLLWDVPCVSETSPPLSLSLSLCVCVCVCVCFSLDLWDDPCFYLAVGRGLSLYLSLFKFPSTSYDCSLKLEHLID